jgi:serine/threonine protein kinase
VVHSALDRGTGELVAIKAISLADSDETDLAIIQKEVAFLQECDHPNIVRCQGAYRVEGSLWIVMDHCAGGSVSDVIQAVGGGLTEEAIALICSEALKVGAWFTRGNGKCIRRGNGEV